MKYFIFILFSAISFLTACGESPTAEVIEASTENEAATPISLAVLQKNERIKIGAIEKRTVQQTVECTGKIEIPPTEVNSVHSKINGQITFLKYLPGDYVQKGALLTTIQNPQLVEKQRQFLETKANLDYARKDYARKKILKAGNATPDKTFDESQNQYDLLTATYNGLKQELTLLGIDMDALEYSGAYQSSVNVYATTSGYVHEVLVNKGQMIAPETRLMEIADIAHLHLEVQVLPKDISGIKKGQKVRFTLPNSSENFSAEIIKINPMLDEIKGTLQVHCHIKHRNKKGFVSGTFVNAQIEKGSADTEGLPLSAVVKEGETYFAFQIKNGEAVKTVLENVRVTDDFVLFDGSKSGDWILEGGYYVE